MIENVLREFITAHKSAVLSKLKATDNNYERLVKMRTQHSMSIFSLTHTDPAFNKLIQDNTACVNDIHDIEGDALYLQGIKDSIEILKLLGIL